MSFPLPPLLVARRPRGPADDWNEATSWFGGRPRLGSLSWPRDAKSGEPMVFAAQIDLAEVAPYASEFPDVGALAFFLGALGSCDGAVIHVPRSVAQRPTDPPSDARPVWEFGSWPFQEDTGPGSARLFPYWPLSLRPLGVAAPRVGDDDFDGEAHHQTVSAAIDQHFARREYFMSAREAYAAAGSGSRPHWWYSAIYLTGCLQNALHHAPRIPKARAPYLAKARADYAALEAKPKSPVFGFGRRAAPPSPDVEQARKTLERLETQEADYQRLLPQFAELVAEAEAFAAGRLPGKAMSADDWGVLTVLHDRARGDFKDIARYAVPSSLDDIETKTILYLATADDADYRSLPDTVRTYINTFQLLPARNYWHQMFGLGVDIQGNAVWENSDRHLLLQLVYDDMMHWRFGDMGAYQFWISPADVKARNWTGARLTFEAH